MPAGEPSGAEVRSGVFDGVACRGARAMLGMTQTKLCALARCGRNTLNDFEMQTRQPRKANVEKLRLALEGLGAEFLDLGEGFVTVRVAVSRPGADVTSMPGVDAPDEGLDSAVRTV